jgi:hypothetical protein
MRISGIFHAQFAVIVKRIEAKHVGMFIKKAMVYSIVATTAVLVPI